VNLGGSESEGSSKGNDTVCAPKECGKRYVQTRVVTQWTLYSKKGLPRCHSQKGGAYGQWLGVEQNRKAYVLKNMSQGSLRIDKDLSFIYRAKTWCGRKNWGCVEKFGCGFVQPKDPQNCWGPRGTGFQCKKGAKERTGRGVDTMRKRFKKQPGGKDYATTTQVQTHNKGRG